MIYLVLAFFLLFVFLAFRNFRLSLGLFIIGLPAYLLRVSIGPLPGTVLELFFWAIFLVWLAKYAKSDWQNLKQIIKKYFWLFVFISLFVLASLLAVFTSGAVYSAFGLWRAYFLEPVLLLLILLGRKNQLAGKYLAQALVLSTVSISLYAVFQKFTGLGISTPEWTIQATRRATAFFSSPNAIGLFVVPILALATSLWNKKHQYLWVIFWIISLLALFFTKSQGALIGLSAGVVVFIFCLGYKKIALFAVLAGVFLIVIVPSLRSAVFFTDRASNNRLILWSQTWDYLSASKSNFIFGAGLRQFYDKVQKPTHDWSVLERHIYPHNIFLNFWSETGLIGLLSFTAILAGLYYLAWLVWKKNQMSGAAIFFALTALLTQGLVDVPYFKNDLAFLFWIIVAYVILSLQPADGAGRNGA
ncbi:MAG: hypothetical protein COU31_03025 [Candidatus Magasanikbacteria bacterium CG10_big_fil_rev_8_21_14_0_10_40_10]|uniref:O-antigen ligase-related domain-containing protein n=1 Tax=Candidatus Magasanikbacteria bacterium CG10_big_fil_rev_8_21_14_0_10_40_10 TaxID=1974648 RepID=A0A2M6W3P7_9BACT|nr:MAG: hypothetical protein COU31_03025 [Candidatus Magasanikbacteria bacterium CG10_big_fil_rev_8_21_14_0_10_40_10]